MATCNDIQRRVREDFDAGRPFGEDVRSHAVACPACARLMQRLEALDAALATPDEASTPPAWLEDRIVAAVREEARRPQRALLAGAGLAACLVGAAAAGRWVSVPLDEAVAYARALDWSGLTLGGVVTAAREAALDAVRGIEVPGLFGGAGVATLWLGVGGGVASLMVFNAIEAARFRRRHAGARGRTAR